MKKSLVVSLTAALIVSGIGLASAQVEQRTTTTTWTDAYGNIIRQDSTTHSYNSITDPALNPQVGVAVPPAVTLHPLPPTIVVPEPDRYSYSIINNHPVIVDRST